jgi:hypothetical protein
LAQKIIDFLSLAHFYPKTDKILTIVLILPINQKVGSIVLVVEGGVVLPVELIVSTFVLI